MLRKHYALRTAKFCLDGYMPLPTTAVSQRLTRNFTQKFPLQCSRVRSASSCPPAWSYNSSHFRLRPCIFAVLCCCNLPGSPGTAASFMAAGRGCENSFVLRTFTHRCKSKRQCHCRELLENTLSSSIPPNLGLGASHSLCRFSVLFCFKSHFAAWLKNSLGTYTLLQHIPKQHVKVHKR